MDRQSLEGYVEHSLALGQRSHAISVSMKGWNVDIQVAYLSLIF